MSVTRRFAYKSGGAGVYPGKGMSSTRTFAIVKPLVHMTVIAIRAATKIAKTCNCRL
jgi:hypothetical protein